MQNGFPQGFYFGAATSAHQVEGENKNDWTMWEKANASRLAAEAKRNPPAGGWPDYILKNYPNPLQEDNYISNRACDHYNRYEEDFDLAKELGHNAHRFSIEWSRIEPEENVFNTNAMKHYRNVVRALRERGMEPFVTLWHWTLPLWLAKKGGVLNKNFPAYFARYAERITQEIGTDVKFWITLNETNVYTGHGYWDGIWPPNKKSFIQYRLANHQLSQAHILAYKIIKNIRRDAQIGIVEHCIWFTRFLAWPKNFFWNHSFFRSIRSSQDFVGVNYYRSDRNTTYHSEFLNWSIDPDGLYHILLSMKKYRKPVYVFENGIADARDVQRESYIRDHLKSIVRSLTNGADVRGYFYWSLLDNFEWDKGFWPRFGLIEVDYRRLTRKIRPSALAYRDMIRNGIPD